MPNVTVTLKVVDTGVPFAILAGVFIAALVIYIYCALAVWRIAKHTKTPNAWYAWVPILNFYLLLKMAKLDGAWLFTLCLPIALSLLKFMIIETKSDVVVEAFFLTARGLLIAFFALGTIYIWSRIFKRLNYPEWHAVSMIIPPLNLIYLGVLAWKGFREANNYKAQVKKTPSASIDAKVINNGK